MTETLTKADSLFADFDEPAPIVIPDDNRPPVKLSLPDKDETRAALAKVRGIADNLLLKSVSVIDGAMHFADLDPEELAEMREPPKEWVDELGMKEAKKRLRMAKAAWLDGKSAPAGFKLASDFYMQETRSRSLEKAGPKSLNVSFIQMTQPMPELPKNYIDVEEDE